MSKEVLILTLIWVVGITSFVLFIPKNSRRRFIFAYLACQCLTWLNSLILVQFNLISFPFREFPKATDIPFTTSSFFYPIIYAFYIHYNQKGQEIGRLLYLSIWVSGIALFVELVEKYTDLIKFDSFTWYWTWLNYFIIFALSNIIYRWFFIEKALFQEDRETTI
ncbi:MAG: hypothetical protein K6T88_05005 [Bacillus sp. (in: Bacteria)]|nr:hypothetical protein [Bacillus sp. (in: firmicutes)]